MSEDERLGEVAALLAAGHGPLPAALRRWYSLAAMIDWLKKRLGGKAEAPARPRVTLEARPVRIRLVQWDDTPEGVVLHVPLRAPGGRRPILFAGPARKTIALDEIGSGIWRLCDGEHTLADLLLWMRQRWQFSYKEAEMGVTNYLKALAERGVLVIAAK